MPKEIALARQNNSNDFQAYQQACHLLCLLVFYINWIGYANIAKECNKYGHVQYYNRWCKKYTLLCKRKVTTYTLNVKYLF